MLTLAPLKMNSFADDQARLRSHGRSLARQTINAHRTWHKEYINETHPDHRLYSVGDHVFAKKAVKSDRKGGLVSKRRDDYTGP